MKGRIFVWLVMLPQGPITLIAIHLAQLLLDDPQWTEERIVEVVKSKQTTRINLPKPVTVILMYWTVNTTDNDELVFKEDVYERDAAVLEGLDKPFTFRETPVLEDPLQH